jgi:hypothetical protein
MRSTRSTLTCFLGSIPTAVYGSIFRCLVMCVIRRISTIKDSQELLLFNFVEQGLPNDEQSCIRGHIQGSSISLLKLKNSSNCLPIPQNLPPGVTMVHEPKVTSQQLSESLFCKSHFLFSFQSQRHITHTQTCLYSQNHEKKQQPQESNDTRYRIQ